MDRWSEWIVVGHPVSPRPTGSSPLPQHTLTLGNQLHHRPTAGGTRSRPDSMCGNPSHQPMSDTTSKGEIESVLKSSSVLSISDYCSIFEILGKRKQLRILYFLKQNGETNASRIAAGLDIDPGTLTYHLKKLEKAAFVANRERQKRAADGSYSYYQLTNRGTQVIDFAVGFIRADQEYLQQPQEDIEPAGIDDADVTPFEKLLEATDPDADYAELEGEPVSGPEDKGESPGGAGVGEADEAGDAESIAESEVVLPSKTLVRAGESDPDESVDGSEQSPSPSDVGKEGVIASDLLEKINGEIISVNSNDTVVFSFTGDDDAEFDDHTEEYITEMLQTSDEDGEVIDEVQPEASSGT